MVCSVSGEYRDWPLGNSTRMSIGLAPVSLASRRPLAATACCLSGALVARPQRGAPVGEMMPTRPPPIARLQVGVDDAQAADDQHAEQAVEGGAGHHPLRHPAAEPAQRVDAG